MAKNLLEEEGYRPQFDLYRIREDALKKMIRDIIYEKTGLTVKTEIDLDDESDRQLLLYISPATLGDFTSDELDKLLKHSFDPEDSYLAMNAVCGHFFDDECSIEYAQIDRNDYRWFDVYYKSRRDIYDMAYKALDTALNGSRDETIATVNEILKRVNMNTKWDTDWRQS